MFTVAWLDCPLNAAHASIIFGFFLSVFSLFYVLLFIVDPLPKGVPERFPNFPEHFPLTPRTMVTLEWDTVCHKFQEHTTQKLSFMGWQTKTEWRKQSDIFHSQLYTCVCVYANAGSRSHLWGSSAPKLAVSLRLASAVPLVSMTGDQLRSRCVPPANVPRSQLFVLAASSSGPRKPPLPRPHSPLPQREKRNRPPPHFTRWQTHWQFAYFTLSQGKHFGKRSAIRYINMNTLADQFHNFKYNFKFKKNWQSIQR